MTTQLLVLQASSLCNLDCTYCYVPGRQDKAVMSEATLRAALRLMLSRGAPGDSVRVLWHAGEPLAAGIGFYRRAAGIIRECTPAGVNISQTIQTNGTLINEDWCRLFRDERILIGLSVDGPATVHDYHRRSLDNRPTHARTMRGAALLRQHGIALQAVAVLTPHSLNFADDIFDFFLDAGFESVGFNLEETEGVHTSAFGIAGAGLGGSRENYTRFMSRLFARWDAAGRRPWIREFESMSLAIGAFLKDHAYRRTADDLEAFRNIVVTRDGDVSTFSPELAGGTPSDGRRFAIGNVHEIESFADLDDSPRLRELAAEIASGVARCRSECEYFPICGGGTASNKFYERGTFDCAETVACALHRKALAHVVADGLRRRSALHLAARS